VHILRFAPSYRGGVPNVCEVVILLFLDPLPCPLPCLLPYNPNLTPRKPATQPLIRDEFF
jgi:hypothetical protein